MPRGAGEQTRVVYQGNNEDFVVFVESTGQLEKWRKDPSIPLAHVVDGYKIFITHKHGAQGILDQAGAGILEEEFGTKDEDEVVKSILRAGTAQRSVANERQGATNLADGPMQPQGYIS